MGQFRDKKAVSSLLKEAILQLCRVSVGMQGNLTVDGIICIGNSDQEDQEFIVKIHEQGIYAPGNPKQGLSSEVEKSLAETFVSAGHSLGQVDLEEANDLTSQSRLPGPSKAQSTAQFVTTHSQIPLDNDVEILDIPSVSAQKHMFGDIDNFSDIECTGCDFDDISFSDVVIKPDPGMFSKMGRTAVTTTKGDHSVDENSDEELKIETLKAGRVRKPNKAGYMDIDGAPVQVISAEEFKRILKSEKLKRSRDKSPDFVNPSKTFRTTSDISAISRHQVPIVHQVAGKIMDKDLAEPQSWNNVVPDTPLTSNIVKYNFSQHYGKQIQKSASSNQVLNSVSQVQSDVNVKVARSSSSLALAYPLQKHSGKMILGNTKCETVSALPSHIQASNIFPEAPENMPYPTGQTRLENAPTSTSISSTGSARSLLKRNYTQAPVQVSVQSTTSEANVVCLDALNKATKSKVHECPVCANAFDTFRQLDQHMYRKHPGMFLCPVCGKMFKQRSTRNRHIVALHSTEKNFTCHICNASFTRTDTLKKHFDLHHPDITFPKKSYSYAKGMSILANEQTKQPTESSETMILQEQPAANSVESKHSDFSDNFITPIQVTAAGETTEPLLSTIISSAANITNISPYLPESVIELEDTSNVVEHSGGKPEQVPVAVEQSLAVPDRSSDVISSNCEASSDHVSNQEFADSTKISLHGVTHIKPIDLTRQLSGIQGNIPQSSQELSLLPQSLSRSVSIEECQSNGTSSTSIGTGQVISTSVGVSCSSTSSLVHDVAVLNCPNEPDPLMWEDSRSATITSSVELDTSQNNPEQSESDSLNTDNAIEDPRNSIESGAKSHTGDVTGSYVDAIEISDEDISDQV